ncbi:hypothetical protein [Agromyces bauzanensis]
MKLVPVPGANGQPVLWVNPEHIASVSRLDYDTGNGVQLRADLKIEGIPLQRINLGDFASTADADVAWSAFLGELSA